MTDPEIIDLFRDLEGVELIQRTPLFESLGFEETRKLAAVIHTEAYTQGQTIVEQDSLGKALYILRLGEVVVERCEPGHTSELSTLKPGELFGEMSLIDDMLVSASVRVTSEQAEVLVLPRAAFDDLIAEDERFALQVYRAFCKTLADRLRMTTRRMTDSEGS